MCRNDVFTDGWIYFRVLVRILERKVSPVIATICTNCDHRVVLTKGTETPENIEIENWKDSGEAGHLVPPGTSILEKLHSDEKYFGRKDAAAKGGWSWRFLKKMYVTS